MSDPSIDRVEKVGKAHPSPRLKGSTTDRTTDDLAERFGDVRSWDDPPRKSLSGKRLLIALAWLAGTMAVTVGLLWIFQRSLIYLPSQAVPPPPPGVDEVTYQTNDGLTLAAWHVPAHPERGAVIVFNGNAGNRSHRLPLARALADRGLSVLLTDYRGYGSNPGSPSEEGLNLDARAALEFMETRVDDAPLVYFGESLGAGVAMSLATEHPPAALILRSPFASLPDIAAVHYRWVPSGLLLRDRYLNTEAIAEVDAPVMVIAGAADSIVPEDQSRAVYEAANQPKQLLVIDGAGHNDVVLLDGEEMIEAITEFFDTHVGS
jgi:uncharacterized protein